MTRLFTYDAWNPIFEWDQWGNWKAMNFYGTGADEILGRYDAALGALIYKQDKQGNVTFVLNSGNQTVEKYTYDAYGTPTVTNGDGSGTRSWSNYGNRFMYTGREWLNELGIYDYRHRYYLPSIGRFIQTDPTGFDAGDMNLYRYCGDDPVDRSDPTGLVGMGGTSNLWQNLMTFYIGNPSMDVILAVWNSNLIRSVFGGAPKGSDGANQASGPAGSPAQNQPGVPDFAIREPQAQYPTHHGAAHVIWKIKLFHHKNQQHLPSGINVSEQVTFSNAFHFTGKEKDLGHFETREDGSVPDIWDLPFDSPNGHVTVTQTIFAGGREATWAATVYANGRLEDDQRYAPFVPIR